MMRPLVVTAVIVFALSGCSAQTSAPAPSSSPTPAPESGPGIAPDDGGIYPILPATHPHVQLTCPLISAVHYDIAAIPPGDVDGVYACTAEPWTPAPDGTAQLVQYVDRVVQEDVPALLAAYAVPDAERTDGLCPALFRDPLIIWLHVGERITPVYAPRDQCGFPTDAADDAYHAVGLERLLVAREKEGT